MKCPYCAEDIKDEAVVCTHCKRDLMFLKPMTEQIKTLSSEVAALRQCVGEISAFLDRQQAGVRNDCAPATMPKMKKLTRLKMLGVIGLHILSIAALLIGFFSAGIALDFDDRLNLFFRIVLIAYFALPIVLGLWMGLNWHGMNIKRYLIVGLFCGLVEALIVLALAILMLALDPSSQEFFPYLVLGMFIATARSIFGFLMGGFVGDWIERRRFPELYKPAFSELMNLKLPRHGAEVGRLDRATRTMSGLTSSLAPVLTLAGVLTTAIVGFYTAREARMAKTPEGGKQTTATQSGSTSEAAPSNSEPAAPAKQPTPAASP